MQNLPANCNYILNRWYDNHCYCDLGFFYGNCSVNNTLLDKGDRCCGVNGRQTWGMFYTLYVALVLLSLLILLMWCVARLLNLNHVRAKKVQVATASFCLCAVVTRLVYFVAETLAITSSGSGHAEPNIKFWGHMSVVAYGFFFPSSALAFVCVTQFWQDLINVMDGIPENPWYRSHLFRFLVAVIAFTMVLEIFRHVVPVFGSERFNALYFVWLCLISVGISINGVIVAGQLYGRLSDWIVDNSKLIFRRVMVAALVALATSLCFVVLSILHALFTRWYVWPFLATHVLCRGMEILFLVFVLRAAGLAKRATALSSPTRDPLPAPTDIMLHPEVSSAPSARTSLAVNHCSVCCPFFSSRESIRISQSDYTSSGCG